MKNTYPQGDIELLAMFAGGNVDSERASTILSTISDINAPILDLNGYSTTYLYEAQSSCSVDAVRLLLQMGADPNYCNLNLISSCALWDLQYADPETYGAGAYKAKYEIAKLFFAFGANPNISVEGETLFDFITFKVYDGDYHGQELRFLVDLYKLLIIYGGGGSCYPKPELTEAIDMGRIDDYTVELLLCDDGYHITGYLLNPEGIRIGHL